ncbi:MAG: DNA/RNA nuclease SfsA [Candidatus Methanoplasma sp.]|jgi:sugar fermentation stimulation protein A|nr:DNA/RNA nuclease SfsA [Candidatus Methanoplasma sp.]
MNDNRDGNMLVFAEPLTEGLILRRRNRFIMDVDVDGSVCGCHCPVTGRIGNIVFKDIPCLLSRSTDPARKTPYTIEAISLDLPSQEEKSWIGINQNAANRYVEYFLKSGGFSDMVTAETVKREQVLGASKLDFLVGDTYIEVKTPLTTLQVEIKEHISTKPVTEFNSFERFVKHINELADSLQQHQRAILMSCFIYDNPRFRPGDKSKSSEFIRGQVQSCIGRGIEVWQVNFRITPTGVSLIRYFNSTEDFIAGGAAFDADA